MGCVGGVRRVFRLRRTDFCFDLGVLGVAEGPARFVFVLYTCHKNEAAEQQQQQQQQPQQMASRLKQQLVGLLPFGIASACLLRFCIRLRSLPTHHHCGQLCPFRYPRPSPRPPFHTTTTRSCSGHPRATQISIVTQQSPNSESSPNSASCQSPAAASPSRTNASDLTTNTLPPPCPPPNPSPTMGNVVDIAATCCSGRPPTDIHQAHPPPPPPPSHAPSHLPPSESSQRNSSRALQNCPCATPRMLPRAIPAPPPPPPLTRTSGMLVTLQP